MKNNILLVYIFAFIAFPFFSSNADELSDLFIIATEKNNLSFYIEVNNQKLPYKLYGNGYIHTRVPVGTCYIKITDGENNAKIRTDISKHEAQLRAQMSADMANWNQQWNQKVQNQRQQQAQWMQQQQQKHTQFMQQHSTSSAFKNKTTYSNTNFTNNFINNANEKNKKQTIYLSSAKGSQHTADLENAIGIRIEENNTYYLLINNHLDTQVSLATKKKEVKKYSQKIQNNELNFLGEYKIKALDLNTDNLAQNQVQMVSDEERSYMSDVDINIPETKISNTNTYALIIANEEYSFLDNVNFADKDGEIFKQYCIKTLGIPAEQIRLSKNATYGILNNDIAWLESALNLQEENNAIVYYCGHGIPDEKTSDAYLVPTDSDGKNTISCYSLKHLYSTLSKTKASRITYFMDACFTGASKEGNMLVAARGIAREAKKEVLEGNSIVFAATSSDETAMTHKKQRHGLFTYYLLKKLQETKGNVTYAELAEYITTNVSKESLILNNKPQTPTISTSPDFATSWEKTKLK